LEGITNPREASGFSSCSNPPFLDNIRRPAPQFRRCGVEPLLKLDPAAAAQYSEPKRGWDGNVWNFG